MVNALAATKLETRYSSQLHLIDEPRIGLRGAIAIDSTVLGPAAGGCRLWRYATTADLHIDALRLARGMSFKNAMAGLPLGGGKAVLQMPDAPFDRTKLFEAFADAVQALRGSYITAEDVGTTLADMRVIRRRTSFVAGLDQMAGKAGGDPSPWTALGVFEAMSTAARMTFGVGPSELTIAIQGAGNVGSHLCGLLVRAGARVVVSDIDPERCAALTRWERVEAVPPEAIACVDADVFAPCALGGALNEASLDRMKAKLVCGAANNQLASDPIMAQLLDRGITYVPDYVANAGGIINVAAEYLGERAEQVEERIRAISGRVDAILARAKTERRSPALVADEMAEQLLLKGARLAA